MMTNDELADRLEWWLAYFDDGTERHPDFADNPYGFDETAIEADLRASALRLREQDRGVNLRTRVNDVQHGYTCKNGHLWAQGLGETCEECGEPRL